MAAPEEVPPFPERVRRKVQAAVAEGVLSGEADLQRIPYVGKWLAPRISLSVAGTSARGSLRQLYLYLSAPPPAGVGVVEAVVGRIGELCQNERTNACVPSRSRRRGAGLYSVRDTNKGCALAVPLSLLEILERNPASLGPGAHERRVTHGLQAAIARVVTRASLPAEGGERSPAAQCTCLAEDACAAQAGLCTWQEGTADARPLCTPTAPTRGFEGVLPFTGQEQRLAEAPGLRPRGVYGPEVHGGRWRRPGGMPRVTAGAQELAWTLRLSEPPHTGAPLSATDAYAVQAATRRHLHAPTLEAHRAALEGDAALQGPTLRTPSGGLSAVAHRHAAAELRREAQHHVSRVLASAQPRESARTLAAKLPATVRAHANEDISRRVRAATRPWWKRGLATATRNELRAALRRHSGSAVDEASLLRLAEADPQIGTSARTRGAASPLTQMARNYLLEEFRRARRAGRRDASR